MVRSGVKLFRRKTLLNFASKAHSNSFFQKTRFCFEFLYKIAPHPFSSPNGLDGTIGGKSVPEWSLTHPKNTFLDGIFWWNRPHTSFLGLIGYMVHSGAKLFRTKTLLNFPSKALSNSFFQETRFRLEFLYWIVPHLFYGPNRLDGAFGGKVSRSEVSSITKNTFSIGIFWQNRRHTSFLGLIGYMVRSGAKLFRTMTLPNFASKALSNSFFQ